MRISRTSDRWLLVGVAAGVAISGLGEAPAAESSVGTLLAATTGADVSATVTRRASPRVTLSANGAFRASLASDAERPRAPIPHADGPPLARTGGFGELTCIECHLDLELNALGGALLLDGIPAAFTPGETYVVTVIVEGEGMGSAGFQAAARFNEGERSGTAAGRLAPLDGRTVVRSEDGIDYINHTVEGSQLGPGDVASWSFEWVAPGEPLPVVFHVTGNSANGDNSPLGDLIYTAEVVVPPGG